MKKGRRLLAILMAICLVCAYMPVSVFGEGANANAASVYRIYATFPENGEPTDFEISENEPEGKSIFGKFITDGTYAMTEEDDDMFIIGNNAVILMGEYNCGEFRLSGASTLNYGNYCISSSVEKFPSYEAGSTLEISSLMDYYSSNTYEGENAKWYDYEITKNMAIAGDNPNDILCCDTLTVNEKVRFEITGRNVEANTVSVGNGAEIVIGKGRELYMNTALNVAGAQAEKAAGTIVGIDDSSVLELREDVELPLGSEPKLFFWDDENGGFSQLNKGSGAFARFSYAIIGSEDNPLHGWLRMDDHAIGYGKNDALRFNIDRLGDGGAVQFKIDETTYTVDGDDDEAVRTALQYYELSKGKTITFWFKPAQDFALDRFDIIIHGDGYNQNIPDENIEAVKTAVLSENGYTYTIPTPEAESIVLSQLEITGAFIETNNSSANEIRINTRGIETKYQFGDQGTVASLDSSNRIELDPNAESVILSFTPAEGQNVYGIYLRTTENNQDVHKYVKVDTNGYTLYRPESGWNNEYEIEVIDREDSLFDNEFKIMTCGPGSENIGIAVNGTKYDSGTRTTFNKGTAISFKTTGTVGKIIMHPYEGDDQDIPLNESGEYSFTPNTDIPFEIRVYESAEAAEYDSFDAGDGEFLVEYLVSGSDETNKVSLKEVFSPNSSKTYQNQTKLVLNNSVTQVPLNIAVDDEHECYVRVPGSEWSKVEKSYIWALSDTRYEFLEIEFRAKSQEPDPNEPDNPGTNTPEPPQFGEMDNGDFAIRVVNYQNGTVEYKIGETGKWVAVENGFASLDNSYFDVSGELKIYLRANPKAAAAPYDKFDTHEGQNRVGEYNLTNDDFSKLENGTFSFVYNANRTNQVQIAFEGSNEPVTERGNLDVNVNLVFWIYENGTYRKATNNVNMEGIKLNGYNVVMKNGYDNVVKGGYALDGTTKNTIKLQDAYGAKSNSVFLIDVSGTDENPTVSKTEGGAFERSAEDQPYIKELDPAVTYNIAIEPGVSDDLTIIWTTDKNKADNWNGGENSADMYVEHGRVEVLKIIRNNQVFYNAETDGIDKEELRNKGINISDDFGYLQLKRGDDIVLKLIPDYGYQLKRVGSNEGESLAQSMGMVPDENQVSTFEFSDIQNNIHFAAVFEKVDNSYTVSGDNVSKVSVQNDKNAIASGTLEVTVADATAEDVSGIVSGEAKTVDISINNVISKGNTENWSSIVSELSSPVEVTLSTEIEIGQEYAVVRNHNGQLKEIQCSADAVNNTISFESDKFSTYTIVKKAKNESGNIIPSAPAPSLPSDNDITNSGSGADASTSVDVSDKTTVTDSKAETKVDADLGNKIVENALKNNSTDVVINAGTLAGDSTGSTVTLPESTVKALAKDTEASVTIKTDSAEVSLDKDAVAAVAAQAGSEGEVKLVVETKEQNKNKVEIELTLVTSNGTVSSFNGGTVTVTVPVSQELADKKVVCVYIDENGKYHKVDGAINEAGTHYTFTTGHFSTYAVMSEEDAEAVIKQQTADEQKAKIKKVKATIILSTKELKKGIRVTVKVPDDQKADKTGIIIYRSTKKDAKTYAVYKKVATKGSTYIIRNTKNVKGQKLTSGKKYYYKVRAYKVIDGKTYYGPMSSVKSIKAK